MPPSLFGPFRLSVVIPTRDTRALTLACLDSLAEGLRPLTREGSLEVLVVDDASTDGTAGAIAELHPEVTVLRSDESRGFAPSANLGLDRARGELLLLLNSDTEMARGTWPHLAAAFERDPVLGIAGGSLRYPDGSHQWSGGNTPSLLWLFGLASGVPALLARLPGIRRFRPVRGGEGEAVEWVTGAAMALRREVWREIGPFDERYRFYCQDLDLCLRAGAAGWRVAVIPGFEVLHHHGATVSRRDGVPGYQSPELLWSDLALWALRHRGLLWARRAGRALRLGGWLRLAGRAVAGLFLRQEARQAWQRDSLGFRRALASVRELLERPPGA